MSNFGIFTVRDANAQYGNTERYIGNLPHIAVVMTKGSTVLAHPGPINRSGGSWNEEEEHCI